MRVRLAVTIRDDDKNCSRVIQPEGLSTYDLVRLQFVGTRIAY